MTTSDPSTKVSSPHPASNGVDVKALAQLARLEVSEAELAKLQEQIPGILEFVRQIQEVSGEGVEDTPEVRNVMREDTDPHEPGAHTEKLLNAAPSRVGDHVAVKQVLSRKKI